MASGPCQSPQWEKPKKANMIDHVILTVSRFERSVAFYSKALKPLGITNFTDYEGHARSPSSACWMCRERPCCGTCILRSGCGRRGQKQGGTASPARILPWLLRD